MIAAHNFCGRRRVVALDLELGADFVELVELEGDGETQIARRPASLRIAPFGYGWYRIRREGRQVLL